MKVTVIGAGLAGSECAWQLAERGVEVTLREMKPEKKTPAHETAYFAELCCSNSLRAAGLHSQLIEHPAEERLEDQERAAINAMVEEDKRK